MISTPEELVRRLAAAHDGGEPVGAVSPDLIPADLVGVYALQDRIMALLGPLGGWKILAGAEGEPLCSPIPLSRYLPDGADIDAGRHRLIIAEVEVAVQLGADLTPGSEVEAAIASLHPVLEFIGDPFADRSGAERNLQLGDLQSNGLVVVGPALDRSVIGALSTLPVGLDYDEQTVKAGEGGASWNDIVAALTWLASHAAGRGLPLRAGQIIITGARLLAPLTGARMIDGTLGEWSSVTAKCRFTA